MSLFISEAKTEYISKEGQQFWYRNVVYGVWEYPAGTSTRVPPFGLQLFNKAFKIKLELLISNAVTENIFA